MLAACSLAPASHEMCGLWTAIFATIELLSGGGGHIVLMPSEQYLVVSVVQVSEIDAET